MTFAVYRTAKIAPGQTPSREVRVDGDFATAGAAMDRAIEMAREDRRHTFWVGEE